MFIPSTHRAMGAKLSNLKLKTRPKKLLDSPHKFLLIPTKPGNKFFTFYLVIYCPLFASEKANPFRKKSTKNYILTNWPTLICNVSYRFSLELMRILTFKTFSLHFLSPIVRGRIQTLDHRIASWVIYRCAAIHNLAMKNLLKSLFWSMPMIIM